MDDSDRLSYYLRRVACGETVEVLDRERPVARIIPILPADEPTESWAQRLRTAGRKPQ